MVMHIIGQLNLLFNKDKNTRCTLLEDEYMFVGWWGWYLHIKIQWPKL